MRQLERINSELFKDLASSELADLTALSGGEKMPTAGYTGGQCESGKRETYSDSRDGHMTKDGWVWDGEAYDKKIDPCMYLKDTYSVDFVSAEAKLDYIELA